jgi:hypothetical protein
MENSMAAIPRFLFVSWVEYDTRMLYNFILVRGFKEFKVTRSSEMRCYLDTQVLEES